MRRVQMRTEDTVVLANETKEFHTYLMKTDHDIYILKMDVEHTWQWLSILRPKTRCGSKHVTFYKAVWFALNYENCDCVVEITAIEDLLMFIEDNEDVMSYEV